MPFHSSRVPRKQSKQEPKDANILKIEKLNTPHEESTLKANEDEKKTHLYALDGTPIDQLKVNYQTIKPMLTEREKTNRNGSPLGHAP